MAEPGIVLTEPAVVLTATLALRSIFAAFPIADDSLGTENLRLDH